MDGNGGCCTARYVGDAYNKSKIDRIMLRFRPIAPKPITSSSISRVSTPESRDLTGGTGRRKRKYVRYSCNTNNKRCNRKKRTLQEEAKSNEFVAVETLPLLPETPERKESPERDSVFEKNKQIKDVPVWLSFNNYRVGFDNGWLSPDRTVMTPPEPVKITSMMVSSVTIETLDTWVDGDYTLGCTDHERMINLEGDTCPGFISDVVGRVTWTNEAYRKMVSQAGTCRTEMVQVRLIIKESFPATAAFSCRVRLQYTCQNDRSSMTLPCDVWRMNGGGFTWRLDIIAALNLGR